MIGRQCDHIMAYSSNINCCELVLSPYMCIEQLSPINTSPLSKIPSSRSLQTNSKKVEESVHFSIMLDFTGGINPPFKLTVVNILYMFLELPESNSCVKVLPVLTSPRTSQYISIYFIGFSSANTKRQWSLIPKIKYR